MSNELSNDWIHGVTTGASVRELPGFGRRRAQVVGSHKAEVDHGIVVENVVQHGEADKAGMRDGGILPSPSIFFRSLQNR